MQRGPMGNALRDTVLRVWGGGPFSPESCILAILLASLVPSNSCPEAQAQSSPSAAGSSSLTGTVPVKILEGKIEHSGSLPPVDPKWKTGAQFDPRMLPAPGTESLSWWKVPEWLVGTWRTEGKIKRLSLKDVESSKSQGFDAIDINYPDIEVIGYQQDKEGSVWTCVPSPYVGRTVQTAHVNVSIIHHAKAMLVSESEVVIKFLATTFMVDRNTNRILSVTQRESLQTYKPIEKGKVLVQASMKFFDENGNARYESKVLSQVRKKGHFRETPYLPLPGSVPTLVDLRKSFDKYLHLQQLDHLIPERFPLPPVDGYKMIAL